MSKIKVKNFGPIKEGYLENGGWMDISKVTIFIGNQGSGKSTIAKLISTLTWIEKALVRGDFKEKDLTINNGFKNHFIYQNIFNYFIDNTLLQKGTLIEYEGKAYTIKYNSEVTTVTKNQENGYLFPKIMYVPSERNFVSTVDKPRSLKNLPQTLYTFLDELEDAKEEIKNGLKLPINNVNFEYQKFSKISYIVGKDFKIRLSEASSGFQSFIPLFLVTRYLSRLVYSINNGSNKDSSKKEISIEEEQRIRKEIEKIMSNPKLSDDIKKISLEHLSARFTHACFINIVEEPEQNLFPGSQRKILNSLLEFNNMNEGNQLIMTTHSPYIINFLSIAIQGKYLLDKLKLIEINRQLDLEERMMKIVHVMSVVAAKDVVVYELDESDGSIKKLPDYEGIPSDKNYLNNSLADGNRLFDELLEIEEEL